MAELKQRYKYFDIAKGIGIILVILGHIEYISTDLRIFIVSFHMPLFFVISGMLMHITGETKRDYRQLFFKKLRRMMLPYLVFSILDMMIYFAYFTLTGRDGGMATIMSDIVQTVTFYGISVLWFLPAIFGAEMLLVYIMKKAPLAIASAITVAIVALSYILNGRLEAANAIYGLLPSFAVFHLFAVAVLRMCFCMGFLLAGYLAALFISKLRVGGIIWAAASIVLFVVTFFVSRMNGVTDLHFMVFNNLALYLIAAISGSFALIALSGVLEAAAETLPLRLIRFYGKNSLVIMATHLDFYILYVAEVGGLHFSKPLLETPQHDMVLSGLSLLFVLVAEVVVCLGYEVFLFK
ncbi:MAG: acyltransferase family protein [Lachnospiraceae bacterium]|nr:acyltransferase family protein [Lachnospiraceae bacterium]